MFTFDYFRAFFMLYTKKWHQYGLNPMSRQRTGIMPKCMLRWKALVFFNILGFLELNAFYLKQGFSRYMIYV
jgi:hypothetical protein